MFYFGDVELWILLFENVGIDESGFVSQMFAAFAEMLREVISGFLFDNMRLVGGNSVPKLGFPLMDVIN
jgi:hypothetical protein